MNLELSDEQGFLRDAAREALSRIDTVAAAREALEGGEAPDLWPTAVEAGWPGLLAGEEAGGAGLGAFEAMLVMQEAGRRLAGVPLLGHLPASVLLDAAAYGGVGGVAGGETRAALVPARPPNDLEARWTVDPERGLARADAPRLEDGRVTGDVPWVVEAPGAGLLVVVAIDGDRPVAVAIEAGARGVVVEDVRRYDATRLLGHVRLSGAEGVVLDGIGAEEIERAWHLSQALLAAEAVGVVETCLRMAVAYAKERFTFGRPIGSYQAVKHGLTEVLRRLENARSLLYYAGWAYENPASAEFATAANAARAAADSALGFATRQNINVHGGIGATWEHDAPLFFRRAELTERLLGGTGEAEDRVAAELLVGKAPAAGV